MYFYEIPKRDKKTAANIKKKANKFIYYIYPTNKNSKKEI